MKKSRSTRTAAARAPKQPRAERTFTLGAVFAPAGHTPDGDEIARLASRIANMNAFMNFWTEASDAILARKKREQRAEFADLRRQERNLKSFIKVQPQADRIMRDCFSERISASVAAKRIRRLIPDRAVAELLFEIYSTAAKPVSAPPVTTTREAAQVAVNTANPEADFHNAERIGKATLTINAALSTIRNAADAGDIRAMKQLVEAATLATTFLFQIEQTHPEVARAAARDVVLWPVLANDKPTWAAKAVRRVAALNLGAGLEPLRIRFRRPRGHDDNWPARQWAKGAVRTIEETRLRIMQFGEVLRGFGSEEALADWCIKTGWYGPKERPWVGSVAKLTPISVQSMPQWKATIRELIRAQIPDFHLYPVWSNHRRAGQLNGRDTKGAIQGRILDDICDAFETLVTVPRSTNPEFASRNPACQLGEEPPTASRLNGGNDENKQKKANRDR